MFNLVIHQGLLGLEWKLTHLLSQTICWKLTIDPQRLALRDSRLQIGLYRKMPSYLVLVSLVLKKGKWLILPQLPSHGERELFGKRWLEVQSRDLYWHIICAYGLLFVRMTFHNVESHALASLACMRRRVLRRSSMAKHIHEIMVYYFGGEFEEVNIWKWKKST